MGTRSLTIIKDEEKEIVVIYRQFDGYPEGHGTELADFLSGFTIVNGYGEVRGKMANGAGCLAAQLVQHLKDGIGNIYLHPAGTRDCWEDYIYVVTAYPGHLSMSVNSTYDNEQLFNGAPEEFATYIESLVEDHEDLD